MHEHTCNKNKSQYFAGEEVKIIMRNFNSRSHNEKDNKIIENMMETMNIGEK